VHLDIDTSIATIAGQRFPAVGLICPQVAGFPETEYDRCLGHHGVGDPPVLYNFFVPFESGPLMAVSAWVRTDSGRWTLDLMLQSSACMSYRTSDDTEQILLGPKPMGVVGGRIVEDYSMNTGVWFGAGECWTVEHLGRLSRMPATLPDGPQAVRVPMSRVRDIYKRGNK
jgi:hypothetical protein